MYSTFKCMALSSVAALVMTSATIASAQSTSDSSVRISKLAGYSGQGFCQVEQDGSQVKAIVRVINLTPGSTATAWLKFDGSTVGRLDGTVADHSGAALFSRTFTVDSDVSSFLFDVRDHNRQLSSIVDDAELTAELNQPTNLVTGESIRMGTCSFDNLTYSSVTTTTIKNAYAGLCLDNLGETANSSIYKRNCSGAVHQQWELKPQGSYYEIANAASGKCLDVYSSSTSLKGQVGQWTCTQGDNQLWDIQTSGSNYQIKSKSSGMCLEVVSTGHAYQYTCDGYVGQSWRLTLQ